jgi:outer membrane lipoprotein-sorting protein
MSTIKQKIFSLALISFIFFSPAAFSDDQKLSAKEIVKISDDLMRGDTNQGIYTMQVITPSWQRELKLQVNNKGRNRTLIRILEPAKENGIGTLRIDHEMWNYLPQVEKTIKIPPSLMLQPWMGSDFANDDLVKESSIVDDYTHHIEMTGTIDGKIIYKTVLTPKPDAPVIWGKLVRWIRAEDFVPLREDFYNEHGKIVKVLLYTDIGPVSDRIIPRTWTMLSKTKPGNSTIIRLMDVSYNEEIDDNIFTLQNLKKIQ